MRKVQKKELDVILVSIDNALGSFQVFEQERSQIIENREIVKKDSSPVKEPAQEVSGAKVDASHVAAVSDAPEDVKISWDQLLRENGEDSEMLDEFICKICQVHVVGCEPKLARCSHLFCGDCIAKWFEAQPRSQSWAQRAQSAGLVPCPVCKEPLHQERDLFSVCASGQNESALLWRLLSGVKITCANNPKCRADGKCTWVGEYGSYQKHIQTCKNLPMEGAALPTGALVVPNSEFKNPVQVSRQDCSKRSNPLSSPCGVSKDNRGHADESTASPKISQEDLPIASKDTVVLGTATSTDAAPSAAQASENCSLTALIQQLVVLDVDKEKEETTTKSASQPLQPAAQQKPVEPAPAASATLAVRAFAPDGSSQLGVQIGDLIQVLSKHESGWTYGRKVQEVAGVNAENASAGWFPNWAIA